jgi:hypothetical protein
MILKTNSPEYLAFAAVSGRSVLLLIPALFLSIRMEACTLIRDPTIAPNVSPSSDTKTAQLQAGATETVQELFARGVALEEGRDGAKDERKAAGMYRRAAEQGYAPAQYNLALLYEEGRGFEQNLIEASRWYRSAAEQGHAEAQNNLGRLCASGQGVSKDAEQAVSWYAKAARQGNVEAQNNLADAFRTGHGVSQDLDKAFTLYRAAAVSGYAVAQNNVALMYANGTGTAKSLAKAYAWLTLASTELLASQGMLDRLRGMMTVEEIKEAERLRQDFRQTLMANKSQVGER